MYPNINKDFYQPPPPSHPQPRARVGLPQKPVNYHDSNAKVQGFGHEPAKDTYDHTASQYFLAQLCRVYFDWDLLSKSDKAPNELRNKQSSLTHGQLIETIPRSKNAPFELTFDIENEIMNEIIKNQKRSQESDEKREEWKKEYFENKERKEKLKEAAIMTGTKTLNLSKKAFHSITVGATAALATVATKLEKLDEKTNKKKKKSEASSKEESDDIDMKDQIEGAPPSACASAPQNNSDKTSDKSDSPMSWKPSSLLQPLSVFHRKKKRESETSENKNKNDNENGNENDKNIKKTEANSTDINMAEPGNNIDSNKRVSINNNSIKLEDNYVEKRARIDSPFDRNHGKYLEAYHRQCIDDFQETTQNFDENIGKRYLEQAHWNVQQAVLNFFENPPPSSNDKNESTEKDKKQNGAWQTNVTYYSEKASNYAKQVITNPVVTDKANQVKDMASNLWKSSTNRFSLWNKNNENDLSRQASSSSDDSLNDNTKDKDHDMPDSRAAK